MASEIRRLPEGADIPGGLMECLLSGPVSDDLASPFPEGVYLLSQPTVEEGVCRVNLSEKYGGLSGVELTLAGYCIVLTLCQVPGWKRSPSMWRARPSPIETVSSCGAAMWSSQAARTSRSI